MKLDISAIPEIAILAEGLGATVPDQAGARPGTAVLDEKTAQRPPTPAQEPAAPVTVGHLAACLRRLVADPQNWWDRVRFDPHQPVRISVPAPSPGCEAWLLVLPPGYRGGAGSEDGWQVGCLVAGAMAAQAGQQGHALRPGRIRVRGGQGAYRMINTGEGYAVSLHARSLRAA